MIKHKNGTISFEPPQNADTSNDKTENSKINKVNNEENDSEIQ